MNNDYDEFDYENSKDELMDLIDEVKTDLLTMRENLDLMGFNLDRISKICDEALLCT
jgi:hypothetical protein